MTAGKVGDRWSGKSTLLRIVGGLLPPTAGRVLMDGIEVPQDEKSLMAEGASASCFSRAACASSS